MNPWEGSSDVAVIRPQLMKLSDRAFELAQDVAMQRRDRESLASEVDVLKKEASTIGASLKRAGHDHKLHALEDLLSETNLDLMFLSFPITATSLRLGRFLRFVKREV